VDIQQRLKDAHAEAQAAFHVMVDAKVYGNPNAPETRAYRTAERLVDVLIADAQWEVAESELAAVIAADPDFAGDHHVYPAGVGR
jgi:hypothetical protein